jgi:hypothetical protein
VNSEKYFLNLFRFWIKLNWVKKERGNDGKLGSTRDAG